MTADIFLSFSYCTLICPKHFNKHLKGRLNADLKTWAFIIYTKSCFLVLLFCLVKVCFSCVSCVTKKIGNTA